MSKRSRSTGGFWHEHSLSLVALGLLAIWIIGYRALDPKTHLGAFFGNAIADWSGSVVIILGTKFLYEVGSSERESMAGNAAPAFDHRDWLGLALSCGKSGEQMGPGCWNIVSEWVQMCGLVFLTKRLMEKGSKESQ